jgi:hypothetical protein
MAMLLFVESMLWSIIGDVGFVVSSVVLATQALLSFHILTGKMETRPPCNGEEIHRASARLYALQSVIN